MKKINISAQKKHTISPYLYMQFMEPLSNADSSVDAGWDYIKDRWQPCLMDVVKELSPTMVRFGGCFASYYHWKEAVGPRESRIPLYNQCWDGMFSNQVGTHEFMQFCREVGAEALMCVNTESDGRMHWAYPKAGQDRFGTAEEAAEWVAYCNDPDNALRLSHGVKDPYNLRYWQIGNETSYDQRGYNADKSAEVTAKFAKAMRAVDPSIKLLGWGDDFRRFGEKWATKLCETAGDDIDLVAYHYHYETFPGEQKELMKNNEFRKNPEQTWDLLMTMPQYLQTRIDQMREEVAPYGKKLAMTESHFNLPGRNRNEMLSSWTMGVAYARTLNTVEHNSDIIDIATSADFFGTRWQVNAVILPTPVHERSRGYLQPVAEIMKLFRHHIGKYALDVSGLEKENLTASLSEDGKTAYLHVVNSSMHSEDVLNININGIPAKSLKIIEIAKDPTNEVMETCPDIFKPEEKVVEGSVYKMPPASVAAIEVIL